MADEIRFDWRLVIGSLSAVSVLTTFVAYVSVQLNDVTENRLAIVAQDVRIESIKSEISDIEQSVVQNKMQNNHLKQTMSIWHGFGDSNEN